MLRVSMTSDVLILASSVPEPESDGEVLTSITQGVRSSVSSRSNPQIS